MKCKIERCISSDLMACSGINFASFHTLSMAVSFTHSRPSKHSFLFWCVDVSWTTLPCNIHVDYVIIVQSYHTALTRFRYCALRFIQLIRTQEKKINIPFGVKACLSRSLNYSWFFLFGLFQKLEFSSKRKNKIKQSDNSNSKLRFSFSLNLFCTHSLCAERKRGSFGVTSSLLLI